LFGGSEIKDRSQHLSHADVAAVFGGATLDLRESHIDDEATVDATALFGGVDVLVPEGWRVALRGFPIFGEDKTHNGPAPSGEAPILYVNATSIFGGVTVAHESS
jgi:nitrogen fixation protein